jgi:hypothetical protein
LYTLYYFLFLLIPLNLLVLGLLCSEGGKQKSNVQRPTSEVRSQVLSEQAADSNERKAVRDKGSIVTWLLAQVGVLILWMPWLPIFWRQATDPPVPPWRTPWQQWTDFTRDWAETLAALLVGQSPPGQINWPWAALTLAVLGYAVFYVKGRPDNVTNWRLVVAYLLGPILLIYLITLTITPLYHVRYLFTYAPPFLILVAAVLVELYGRQRLFGGMAVIGLVVINGWSLQQFWFAPLYRADDHRTALRELAEQWRPGDVILVNAGWVYTALLTYWPTEVSSPDSALPPALGQVVRLTDYADRATLPNPALDLTQAPVLVRTGSVDGSPRLGWGDSRSDFFAVSSADTVVLLRQLGANHTRIWHYRLYDTVSDPYGVIRSWLAANTTLLLDHPIAGRDYLRLQLYQSNNVVETPTENGLLAAPISFDGKLTLTHAHRLAATQAGAVLYVQTHWQVLPAFAALDSPLAFSLRLYDAQDQLIAQHDEAALPPTTAWLPETSHTVSLALPVPVATRPDVYQLALVVYAADSGQPLLAHIPSGDQPMTALGAVTVTVSQQAPPLSALATFDYLDLMTAETQVGEQALTVNLVWHPRPHSYIDTYFQRSTQGR